MHTLPPSENPALFASVEGLALDGVLHGMGDALCITDGEMRFLGANLNFARFYGLDDPAKLIGRQALEMYPGFRQSVFYEACARTAQTGQTTTRYGFSANIKQWVVMRCYQCGPDRFAMVVHRVSDEAQKSGYAPKYDTLTSLPNRVAFEEAAQRLSENFQRIGLLLIDVVHFKDINERLGFPAGDRCLMQVAARLRQTIDPREQVYRLGNDQFLVLGAPGSQEAQRRRVLEALAEPVALSPTPVRLDVVMASAETTERLAGPAVLTHAELALRHAKQQKLGYVHYVEGMGGSCYDPILVQELRAALAQQQFHAVFQPQADLIDGKPCGAEALVRWQHPQRGLVSPADFLPVAEESGLVVDIDRVMARAAMEQAVRLHAQGLGMPISFNLSSQSLCSPDTAPAIAALVEQTGADPAWLGVEITETSLMHDLQVSQQTIAQLRGLGLHIAIDDFGSGYSSMAYLLRYPSHFLKIDREFIQALGQGATHQRMVRNLIGLAHGMGIGVIAEGVETPEQTAQLKEFGCDLIQGYGFSRPLSAQALEDFLRDRGVGQWASDIR